MVAGKVGSSCPNFKRTKIPNTAFTKGLAKPWSASKGAPFYVGLYNTPESKKKYRRLCREWRLNYHRLPDDAGAELTVVEAILAYWRYAKAYCCNADGTSTSELACIRQPLRLLKRLYGDTPANEFRPKRLKVVRAEMIRKGWSRRAINKQIARD